MRNLVIILLLSLTGCAGGGGSIHHPPKEIIFNSPTKLELVLSTWGAGSGEISERYTELKCFFKTNASKEFISILSNEKFIVGEKLIVQFIVPPIKSKDATALEYYFDMKFDGSYNKRDHEVVAIKHIQHLVK